MTNELIVQGTGVKAYQSVWSIVGARFIAPEMAAAFAFKLRRSK
jgi:hypothetical protein